MAQEVKEWWHILTVNKARKTLEVKCDGRFLDLHDLCKAALTGMYLNVICMSICLSYILNLLVAKLSYMCWRFVEWTTEYSFK